MPLQSVADPIVYDQVLATRFSDLDPYGHVNAAKYLDFVATARFLYCENVLETSFEEIARRGSLFFLTSAQQQFKRGIQGVKPVRVLSKVTQMDGPRLYVEYTIASPDEELEYASGRLEYVVIDPTTKRPKRPSEWLQRLFMRTPLIKD
jgi:acyl-CoA thioesterase FadM